MGMECNKIMSGLLSMLGCDLLSVCLLDRMSCMDPTTMNKYVTVNFQICSKIRSISTPYFRTWQPLFLEQIFLQNTNFVCLQ